MEQGLLDFFGLKCVFTQLDDEVLLFLIDKSQRHEFYQYSQKKDYLLNFSSSIYKDSYIHVKETYERLDHSISIEPTFIAKMIENNGISKLRIQGDELDVFYSPSRYFFIQKETNKLEHFDLRYEKTVAFTYCFECLGKKILAEISFGKILSAGIRSDLVLHPTLELTFDITTDINFIFRLYKVVLQFLQFVNHKQGYNMHRAEIIGEIDNKPSSLGYLYNHKHVATHLYETSEAQYLFFEPYIECILNLFANDLTIPIKHFPNGSSTWDYDAFRFAGVFAAFEYECEKLPKIYKNASDNNVKPLKQRILDDLHEMSKHTQNAEEISFIENANARIAQLWTELGQARKIEKAYTILNGALLSSMSNFFLDKEKSVEDQIKAIAVSLSRLRGKVLHGELNHSFTDEEKKKKSVF